MHATVSMNTKRDNRRTMNNDCGAPVFNNVDELLSEKIASHSLKHTDSSTTPAAPYPVPPSASAEKAPAHRKTHGRINICISILLLIIIIILFHRAYRPSSD